MYGGGVAGPGFTAKKFCGRGDSGEHDIPGNMTLSLKTGMGGLLSGKMGTAADSGELGRNLVCVQVKRWKG